MTIDSPPSSEPEPGPSEQRQLIAGFWKRLLAFIIDGFLLGIFGFVLGSIFFDTFARLGVWGKLVGFGISLGYFGVMNSTVGNGQTLGKRLTGIKVVNQNGQFIGLNRSLLRYTILSMPFFLNGALIPPSDYSWLITDFFSLIIFGLGLTIIYLFIFNRRTRQSAHDLAVSSYVVPAGINDQHIFPDIWKYHFLIIGVWLVLLLIGSSIAIPLIMRTGPFADLMQIQKSIQDSGKVKTSSVFIGKQWGPGNDTSYMAINAIWKEAPASPDRAASEIAAIVLQSYPDIRNEDVLGITITCGFDIGIASSWEGYREYHSPAEWENILQTQ